MDAQAFFTLKQELSKMEGEIILILHPGKNTLNIISDVLYILTNYKNIPGVFVTILRPYTPLESKLTKKGVDTDKIIFIDAVTRSVKKVENTSNCIYVDNPKDLTDINLYIDAALSAITFEKKFIFFDSLSTLAMFNTIQNLSKFFYFLTTKIRVNHVEGILLSMDKSKDKESIKEITKYCDRVIEL